METRASHSSPCFLRVADASAASSASKMTSLSTPFSLETASTTIKISLFIYSSPLSRRARNCRASSAGVGSGWRQSRLGNLPERHLSLFFINFQRDPRLSHHKQRARVAAASSTGRAQLNKHPLARKARKMRRSAQHPVKTGRGHLERIRGGNRILDVEQRRRLTAHPLA